LAGAKRGILNLPGVKEDVGLIGVHFRGQFVELVPWNGSVSWDVAPWGRCVYLVFLSQVQVIAIA
jgi:tocopherol cyclase